MTPAATVARAAVGVAALTVVARVVGFGRVGVLTRTVGTGCVGDAYTTANQLPNVVFEVVAGGALAAAVVPLLAGAVARGDRERVSATASALLSWTLLVLTPVAVVGVVVAPLLLRALAGAHPACGRPLLTEGTVMLRVFMPQVVLYGVAVVLSGILQAHRRFLGPALAPLLSSLVVVGTYLLYAAQGAQPLAGLSTARSLVLSVGTTLGVAALALPLLVPLRRCGLRLRPGLRFPPGAARQARGLAASGLAGLATQQVALLIALRLANGGREGDVVVLAVATAVFQLPWAVLALPVATTAFPVLTARHAESDERAYAAVARQSLRAVLVLSAGASGLLVLLAGPAARLLAQGAEGTDRVAALAATGRAFAPGLVGYALLALLGRALLARGDARTPAMATVAGWAVVAAADLVLVGATALPRTVALGLGNSIGMTVAAALLLVGVGRNAPLALRGTARTAGVSLLGGACVAAGTLLLPALPASLSSALAVGTAVGLLGLGGYLLVVRVLDPQALRGLLKVARV